MANLSAVLDKVNAARVAAGFEPLDSLPKGTPGNAASCPLARAFRDVFPGATVGGALDGVPRERAHAVAAALGTEVAHSNAKATLRLPRDLQQFVGDFDNGLHPQLRLN